MKRSIIIIVIFLFCGGEGYASNYDLTSIDLIGEEGIKVLANMKIYTTDDLWKATLKASQRIKIAKALGISLNKLKEIHNFCDLLRIQGIGPKVVKVLTLAGIKTTLALSKQNPKQLTTKIIEVNKQHEILGKLPDEALVQEWIEKAKILSKVPTRR